MADSLLLGSVMADDAPATTTARIAVDLLEKARIVCAHTKGRNGRQLKLTDYLDRLLRGPITKDHREIMRRIQQGEGEDAS